MKEILVETASRDLIETTWSTWGMPIVSVGRHFWPRDVEGLIVPGDGARPRALITWAIDGERAQIVTLDAFEQNRGFGTRLIGEAERILAEQGVREIRLMTTNDNLHALRFYLRQGYRLARVHLDAMDEVYRVKPQAPRTGNDGIALRDLWELVKTV